MRARHVRPSSTRAPNLLTHHVRWLNQVTYHGPGQLVVYPIVSLRELGLGARAYVEGLEDALIRTAGVYGISARVSF